ncbi:MAG: ethanolamine ammonia-lyase subunit EutC [Bacteroidaceae bacterium]|nr:ethanolamine ammonia-lyase subunit EutC [Bacteroidaceae bacterium]
MNEVGRHIPQHERDCWEELRRFTDARIALGHAGASMPTAELLRFSLAHAQARDAVHLPLDKTLVRNQLEDLGLEVIDVHSDAFDRHTFLTRPDLGRRLCEESRMRLQEMRLSAPDIVFVVGDGLSAKAVHRQAVALLRETMPYMRRLGLAVAPIVLAEQCRVALGDEIAQLLHARLVAMLIGERPGLSSPDSLGVYLTHAPHVGSLDSERNCLSNIRPEGLPYPRAAFKLAWLVESALAIAATGTALKDQSDDSRQWLKLRPMTGIQ